MINKINFLGKLYTTQRINKKTRANELKTLEDYAKKQDADIFVFEKTSGDKKITYEALACKNGTVWYKSFTPHEMNNTVTRTLSGDRIKGDPLEKIKNESKKQYLFPLVA